MPEHPADQAQRLLRTFGEVLPENTTDDRSDEGEETAHDRDRWLRDNRPPHHDGPL